MYKVPFVDYPEHYNRIWNEIMNAITESLSKGDLILRDQLKQFERNLADFVGTKYAIGLNSGTDALLLSLKAVGIGPGDEVITVAHTFVATVSVVIQCGGKPILVDIGDDMNIDVEAVEKAITPRTRAIIPVHLNGRTCDMERLSQIAEKYDLFMIEDAAQALGACFGGSKAGSFGSTSCFSFYPAKILGCAGDGGAILTNDSDIAEKIYLLRDHGYQRSTGDILCYGYNSRLDNIQAAVLDVKLRHLPEWIERRRELANLYNRGLSEIDTVRLPPSPCLNSQFFDVYQNYVIRSKERNRLRAHLKDMGIETLVSWAKPMHHNVALNLNHFCLPETEKISQEVLSLPMYPELSDEQIEYVVKTIQKFY